MANKRFFTFLAVAALLTCSLISGGCGGGSSSSYDDSGKIQGAYMFGTVNSARVAESNLYPIIAERIKGTININGYAADSVDIGSLGAGNILFFADASELNSVDQSIIDDIWDAYAYEGVALVALYPDSEDLSTMSQLIGINLTPPVSGDGSALPNPHYEYFAASRRILGSDGAANTFLYPMDHENNQQPIDEKYEVGGTTFERKNYSTSQEYSTAIMRAMGLTEEQIKAFNDFANEVSKEYRKQCVDSLFTWAAGIDQAARDMEAEFSDSVATLKASAGGLFSYDKLTAVAEGVTTQINDRINLELTEYFRRYGYNPAVDGDTKTFLYKCGFGYYDDRDLQLKYMKDRWGPGGSSTPSGGLHVKHETATDYTIIGLHSFKDQSNYYLVKTKTITQPSDKSLFISALGGTRTSDLLRGGDTLPYHYGLILGGNRGFTTKVYMKGVSVDQAVLKSYIPSKTVNNNTTVADSHSLAVGGGVVVGWMNAKEELLPKKDGAEKDLDSEGGDESEPIITDNINAQAAQVSFGDASSVYNYPVMMSLRIPGVKEFGGSFKAGVSHTGQNTWEVKGYSITPTPYYEDYYETPKQTNPRVEARAEAVVVVGDKRRRRVAAWDLNVEWPRYDNNEHWQMAHAFNESVTLATESIWQTPADKNKPLEFYGQTNYILGFCWAHKMPSQSPSQYNLGLRHTGTEKKLNYPKIPLIGIEGAVRSGSKAGRTYTAKIYSESFWTARSDSDWLTIPIRSGSGGSGMEFYFTARPNETGKARIGYITVENEEGDRSYIRFTQSPY